MFTLTSDNDLSSLQSINHFMGEFNMRHLLEQAVKTLHNNV